MTDAPAPREMLKVTIEWSTREYFTAEREIDKAEFLEWAGNPALDTVDSKILEEYLKSGREEPHREYELEAMAEGVSWHDRSDPRIDGAMFR